MYQVGLVYFLILEKWPYAQDTTWGPATYSSPAIRAKFFRGVPYAGCVLPAPSVVAELTTVGAVRLDPH